MRQKELTQNVIVDLDLNELATIIKEADKNKSLLGNWDLYSDNLNEVLLHRFGYLKGTYDATRLLGVILDGIQYALKFKYYINYNDEIYCIEGKIGEEYETNITDIYNYKSIIDDWTYGHPIVVDFMKNHEYIVKTETKNIIRYYREYFTRIFDRGKTIK